jgi:hypothetical protein
MPPKEAFMKKSIVFVVVLAVFLLSGAAAHGCIANDPEYMVVFRSGVSWEDAKKEVGTWGAEYHLATITSREEQKYLQKLLRGLRGEFWVGGFQDALNKWNWVTNEPWQFTNWAKGEANDYYGPDSEQHLAIWSRYGKRAWKWNDEGNLGNISGFIVERSIGTHDPPAVVTPIPAAAWLLGSGLAAMVAFRRLPNLWTLVKK